MFRFTPVVKNLLIINILVYVGQQLIPVLTEYIALWGISTPYFKPYQLFTYMFAHDPDSFWHLAGNMLFLVFIGPILEEYWGQKKFLFFYMAAGIGAAIFYVVMGLFSGGSFSVMYGASGAVYGVMTAFGIIFSEMEIRIFFFIPVKAKYLVLILGSMAIVNSFGPLSGGGDGIAHLAHLGGIVVAIILLLYWKSKGRY